MISGPRGRLTRDCQPLQHGEAAAGRRKLAALHQVGAHSRCAWPAWSEVVRAL